MNEIEKAIETLRKISDVETSKRYRELHEIKCFNYDLLTAIHALQEKLERENPKPLGLEEMKNMIGNPIWCKWLFPRDREFEPGGWFVIVKDDNEKLGFSAKKPLEYGCGVCGNKNYGKTWLAYRHKPDLVNVNKIEHIGEANNMIEGE